jgi:transglutaminase-like putative cysteine protease
VKFGSIADGEEAMTSAFVFFGRLGLYFILMGTPLFLPAVNLYWEGSFILRALVLVPAEALLAWYSIRLDRRDGGLGRRGPWSRIALSHLLAAGLPLLFLPWTGISKTLLDFYLAGAYSYISTYLIFRRKFGRLMYPEPFLYAYYLQRMMSFSRASEDAASAARGFNNAAFILMIVGFLSYAVLIYRYEYRSRRRAPDPRESIISAAAFTGIALALALLTPPDFVSRLQVLNNLDNILQPELRPLDRDADSPGNRGNLLGEGDDTDENGEEGEGQLYLMSADRWGSNLSDGQGRGGMTQNQYLVMVVSTPRQPVYLADEYYNLMDPVRGFYSDPAYELNLLANSQFLESWMNPDPAPMRSRIPVWVDIFSTIPDKVASYEPLQLEPAVFDTTYYPLSYSYRSRSLISTLSLNGSFPRVSPLTGQEREDVAEYLEVNLPPERLSQYQAFLDGIIDGEDSFMERIIAILRNYSSFQYELGFTDNVSIEAISSFLFENRTGDCTEFSNSAAILGRLAGIPSRVVTGYLVSRGLQNPNHVRALEELQRRVPPLAAEDLDELYLVTTAHRHSWTQFYLPVYGWVDFEATAFAIPPAGNMNPNNLNVVIPDIRERTVLERNIQIPWGLLLRLGATAAGLSLAAVLVIRWLRIGALALAARSTGERGCKARYRLLLVRLRARGYELKHPDATPAEYAKLYPELDRFASMYVDLVYGPEDPASRADARLDLDEEYRRILSLRRGLLVALREAFSLRDLRYL